MLLFDAGNSRCKWAWVEKGRCMHQGVFDNADEAAWQTLGERLAKLNVPQRIIISNVAGRIVLNKLQALCSIWPCPVEIITSQAEQCGVVNHYEQSAQLGSDRWAALIAAWHHVQHACLVVNCGTATTIDALSDKGEFLGGLILPGIALMQHSLLNNTAQLSQLKGELHEFPRNTADAIESGVIRATVGAIQHQYELLKSTKEVGCVLSGGAANIVFPQLSMRAEQMEGLVLQGLQIIGQNCLKLTQQETVA